MTDFIPFPLPADCRQWSYYPIVMPLTKYGHGPAAEGQIHSLTWEVWDWAYLSHSSHDNLPDAINKAMELSIRALIKEQNDE